MKFGISIFFVVAVAILGAWHFTRPVFYVPGKVENQIQGFGAQLGPALAQKSSFTKTANGYEPKPDAPQAPAGLKPAELQAWTAFAERESGEPALATTFPGRYSGGTEVRSEGMAVTLTPLGSNGAAAQIENGKLVYHGAYTDTDSMQVVSDGKSEEFLLLHDAQAPQRFEYDLSGVSGVKKISLTDNAIHFTNVEGKQLEIEAPWLIESGGQKVEDAVHWELSYPSGQRQPRLALVVTNAKELHYPVVIDPTWVAPNGSLNNAHYVHTATLLPNGQVLVAGGIGTSGSYLNSAELYNPATGVWTTTGSLNSARAQFTATLLPNGEVLVAGGGSGPISSLASAELYNPTSGTWTATGNLNSARQEHTATLLPNGEVLVAGGYVNSSGSPLSSAELYNPATGTWTATGSLNTARWAFTATLLPNGKVLAAGGANTSGNQNSAELYDPATGTWTATGNLGNARYNHTATLLANGEVLVAGGGGNSGDLSSAELYNPASGTWTATGSLNNPRLAHTATLLPNGEVLVAAGLDNSDYLMSAELYDPVAGTWTATASLNTARYGHTATLLANGEVLVAGGSNGTSGFLTSTELFDPATGAWTTTGSLNTPHYVHTATLLPNGEVLVAGGIGTSGSYLTSAELFDAGLGYGSATQPQLNAVTTASSTSALSLTGTNFTGVSEGSGGETNNSSSNIPVVELQSLVNEQTINVPLDPSHGFSSTAFTSLPPSGLVPGYALLTMFVNGTPSVSQIVLYSQAAQTISNFPATETVSLSASPDTLAATTSGGLTITYTVVSGPGTVSGDTLTLTGTGTVVVMAAQAGNGTYAPLSETETITVTTAGNPTDTPTMPPWGLVVLAGVLMMAAGKSLRGRDASGLL